MRTHLELTSVLVVSVSTEPEVIQRVRTLTSVQRNTMTVILLLSYARTQSEEGFPENKIVLFCNQVTLKKASYVSIAMNAPKTLTYATNKLQSVSTLMVRIFVTALPGTNLKISISART